MAKFRIRPGLLFKFKMENLIGKNVSLDLMENRKV